MTTFHPLRSEPAAPPIADRPPCADGAPTAVTGWDGSVLATFTRRVHPRAGGALTVIAVDGDIDQDTAPVLRDALVAALDDGSPVCCDITRVEFFGAAGIHTVLAAHRHAADGRRVFFLRGVHGIADRVLRIAGLTGVVPVDA